MTSDDYSITKLALNSILPSGLDWYFSNHTYNDYYMAGDLEYLVMLSRGLLNVYECLSLNHLESLLKYFQACIFTHTQIVYSYQP